VAPSARSKQTIVGLILAVVVAALAVWLATGSDDDDGVSSGQPAAVTTSGSAAPATEATIVTTSGSAAPTTETTAAGTDGTDPVSGLDLVELDELPPEALDTLELIESGGPFPYERDGVTFENREGILPDEVRGYYREYTVETPGSDDRGARRIVIGKNGEYYYTADHYDSFQRVVT
jgi:ribonuclease T1